jgi:hypothetical protein
MMAIILVDQIMMHEAQIGSLAKWIFKLLLTIN